MTYTPRLVALALPDGHPVETYVFSPPPEARQGGPAVVYLHGIQSHPGWFFGSAAALARAGCAVYMPTRRGSGTDLVDRGHAGSADELLGDVRAACELARADSGRDKLVLVGVSWGGKLAAAYAVGAGVVERLVLVAPGLAPAVDLSLRAKLGVAVSLLAWPRRQFEIPLSDPGLFTDNGPMLDYIRSDRCRLTRATARFLYASWQLDRRLGRAPRGCITAPTTLILAERDRIIDNAGTQRLCERLTDNRAEVVTLSGCHTLEFEADVAEFYQTLVTAVGDTGRGA